ncbi:hypothetical protein L6164_030083 [Bauhinia variegata]|uniref:Uncharacterized protein n=1 Tax=Bauhinia variegata TaxID=167791 RepID=A0ACB9LCK9_BAUVA|nr:hypothetical protein L6164_030083 [Bauhinia variegata]
MFAKLFQQFPQQQHPQHNVVQGSSTSAYLNPQVVFHYGVPATASILAFDHIQSLLAVGTLDGRIKVFGGDTIEGILFSPKQSPFKYLEFLQNQGFLVSVSNDNEIQVWDLERRQIASALRWESAITAFSVIYGTCYMYIGSEHGMVFVVKFNSEDGKLDILPYYVPTNIIAEAVRMSLDNVSVVRVLHQPCSQGNRLLIAYENGLIVLWDASEDQIVLVRGHKDLELKKKKVSSCPTDANDELSIDKLDHKEEKEISSLCWASNDGSVIAVGYIDGDIMLWDLSTASNTTDQQAQNLPSHVVKLQLSSADRRLPIIVLHFRANNSNKNHGGQLFVYGGDEIGSEEVLSVLSLDWSSGIESLKCISRVDITLHGSFADMVLLTSDCPTERDFNMLYVLTNPGQLHLYDGAHLSSLMSQQGKKTFVPAMQYPMVIPTIEPYMTTAKLGVVYRDSKSFGALSEIVLAAQKNAVHNQKSSSIKSPLTGGIPAQLLKEKDHHVYRMYIAGYQDGSVRIWDATYPALSLVYHIESEVKGIKIDGANAPVSALEFCTDTLQLAVGNECGVVRLYGLIRNSHETTMHVVTENGTEVQNLHQGDGPHCTAVFSVLNSAICTLNFANLGGKLTVGYECGRVALFDISTSSILFLTNTGSDISSPVISLNVKFSDTGNSTNIPRESVSGILDSVGKGLVFMMLADARVVAIDMASGDIVCTRSMNPKKDSNAISMHIIDVTSELSSENLSNQDIDSRKELIQTNIQTESTPVEVETASTVEISYLEQISLNSHVLLCYESELSLHSLKSLIEDCSKFIRKVNLVKRCCWTTTFKKDEKRCGLVVLYQTGDIELRSLPTLEVVGESSLMSILRWNLKTNMEKTICSSSNGQIILVNGNETAFISLLNNENEFRIPESLPCLHDKVLAAAVDATASLSPRHNEKEGARGPALFVDMLKNLKLGKTEQNADQAVHISISANLERLFSYPPFLKPDKQDSFDLDIDEIRIDEPAPVPSSEKIDKERDKGKGTDRQKLLEDEGLTKPRLRTAEEVKAKYRKAGDAAAAAALARDKLAERQEKLERLSKNTEELQSGAQDFASMASELAKRMENRKWWQM